MEDYLGALTKNVRARILFTSIALMLSLLLLFSRTASAQLPGIIPQKILFSDPVRTRPRVSPDGKKLAYLAPDGGVQRVWVRTLGQSDDRVVTANPRSVSYPSFFWQADSEHILYYMDNEGDEQPHIYQTQLAAKLTRDLTPFVGRGADAYTPPITSPDFPDLIIVPLYLREGSNGDLYRINLRSGAVEMEAENPGTFDTINWKIDHRLQTHAVLAYLPDGHSEIQIRDGAQSGWRTLLRWSPEDSSDAVNRILGFTPDGKHLLVVSLAGGETTRLLEVDIQSGALKVVAEDRQYDISDAFINPRTRALEAVQFYRARGEWAVLDDRLRADFERLGKIRDGDFEVVSRDREDNIWIVSYTLDDGPVYFYSYERPTGQAQLLFSNRPALEKFRLAKMQPISFKARDGLVLEGYLTLPVGTASKHLPMVLLVHGGPDARDVWGFNAEAQWLANRGYAVLQVNFRGSTGYGKKHYNAGSREWGGKMHDDLIDGKRWAVGQGYANSQKVCIMGESYGGYATLAGLAFTPDEFACGISMYGPSNLTTLIESFPYESVKSVFYKRVGNPQTEPEFLRSRSPLFKADHIKAPLLIAQGANDPRVKQAESDKIVEALRRGGKQVEYILFPDEGHGFSKPENRLKFYAAAEQFLARHLGGRVEASGQK